MLWIRLPFVRPEARPALRAEAQHRACRRVCRILNLTIRHQVVPPAGPALIVSNHMGILDSFILASVFHISFVGKADLASAPVIGWICRTVGLVAVEREQRMAASKFVGRVRERLTDGVSVLVFPEGTTSDGAAVRPFKTSVFEAITGVSGAAVQPVCITIASVEGRPGSRADEARFSWADPSVSLGQHTWRVFGFREAVVDVLFGDAFPAESGDRRSLALRAHEVVTKLRRMSAPGLASPEREPAEAVAGIHGGEMELSPDDMPGLSTTP